MRAIFILFAFAILFESNLGEVYNKYGCDFETPCTLINTDKYWRVESAADPLLSDAPNHDHTYENSSGHYISFDLSAGFLYQQSYLKFKDLVNLTLADQQKCLQFYYMIDSDESKNFSVWLVQGDNRDLETVWLNIDTIGNRTSDWSLAQVNLPNDAYFIWLMFDFKYEPTPTRLLLVLDDIFITDDCKKSANREEDAFVYNNKRRATNENKVIYWCDFERDDCSFESTMDYKLKRIKASEKEIYGPDKDHTLNSTSGHYLTGTMIEEMSDGFFERAVSVKIEVPNDDIPYCVSFYYYLEISYVQALVTAIPLPNDSADDGNVTSRLNYIIWRSGVPELYSKWNWGIARLAPGTLKLSLIGDNRKNAGRWASFDDIKVHSCHAQIEPLNRFDPDNRMYFEYECSFEKDDCGFSETYGFPVPYPSNWSRINSHQNKYPEVGPPVDHTTESADGHFFTVNFTEPLTSDFSAISSAAPVFAHKQMCVEFFLFTNAELFSESSDSQFFIATQGCYYAYLIVNYPFRNQTTPEWKRVVVSARGTSCKEWFNFIFSIFNGNLVNKMSVSIDDLRIDRCDRIDPPTSTTTTIVTSEITTTPFGSTTKTSQSSSTLLTSEAKTSESNKSLKIMFQRELSFILSTFAIIVFLF